jgi:hypothetical protein
VRKTGNDWTKENDDTNRMKEWYERTGIKDKEIQEMRNAKKMQK